MFVVAPFDVLHPVDAHVLGQPCCTARCPTATSARVPAGFDPGHAPAGDRPGLLAPSVLALQAVICEVIVWRALGEDAPRRRFLLLSTLAFPVLSGGFDAVSMAAWPLHRALTKATTAAGGSRPSVRA